MTSGSADDPIEVAIASVIEGMDAGEAAATAALVREGIARMDTTAPPEFLAREEIAPATDLAPQDRLGWAREFAVLPLVARLNGRAWQLVQALVDGSRPSGELSDEAQALLANLEAVDLDGLEGERLDRVVRRRNEAIADARWVMSGGSGPASLRAGRHKNRPASPSP